MDKYIEVKPQEIKVGKEYYFIPTWGYCGIQTDAEKLSRFLEEAECREPHEVLAVHQNKYKDRLHVWYFYEGYEPDGKTLYQSTEEAFISETSTVKAYVKNPNYKYVCKRFCQWCAQSLSSNMAD